MTRAMTRSPLAPAAFPAMSPVAGVRLSVARAGYKAWDRADLTLAQFDPGTTVAGVLTRSRCPSPEVDWCRAQLPHGRARVLVVNAGNSNAFTGKAGEAAVQAVVSAAITAFDCPPNQIFVASTGVIGVPLPFVSYGGTALVTILTSLGILMGIQSQKKLVQT